jgi:hypothetical protein
MDDMDTMALMDDMDSLNALFLRTNYSPIPNAYHTHVTRMILHGCHMGVSWVSHACLVSDK